MAMNTLLERPNWNEIATLIRLALIAGPSVEHATSNQLYVPEIIHLVTIVSGVGPSLIRKSVYGIILNLLQSLHASRTDELIGPELLNLITDSTKAETLRLFGLRRETPTCEYTNCDVMNDKEYLDNQELLTDFLVRVLEVTSGSKGKFVSPCL